MKYGQQLEHESVPKWRLHNFDYNSLKHEIKRHTSSDDAAAAAAMAIPGHPDLSLCRFEDGLYRELERQHSRLDLFVSSKADEVARRLEHLDVNLQRCIRKAAEDSSGSFWRQRRLAKYERELLRCGQDILALSRFASAQVVAFRKILKKYRKWTGSTSLASRLSQSVLASPKSFTKRDFVPLQLRHDELLADLEAATAEFSEPGSPAPPARPPPPPRAEGALPAYWNEYDDGSDGEYAIYVDPDHQPPFPGLAYVRAVTARPYERARRWFARRSQRRPSDAARLPMLCAPPAEPPSADSLLEDGYASGESQATKPAVAASSPRPRADAALLPRATAACFLASYALLAIAGLLMTTGRRKLRVEVDAGVTAGVMASLACACCGLGMTLCRRDGPRLAWRLLAWAAFVAACLCDGMLLVLVLVSGT